MINKLLCKIGLHNWIYFNWTEQEGIPGYTSRICRHCERVEESTILYMDIREYDGWKCVGIVRKK